MRDGAMSLVQGHGNTKAPLKLGAIPALLKRSKRQNGIVTEMQKVGVDQLQLRRSGDVVENW